jgi:hypothetical protein
MGWVVNNPDWPSGEGEHLVWVEDEDDSEPDTAPSAAREAVADAWAEILRRRHPGISWDVR